MPGLTRWLTTARAAIAPLALNSSIQSLSTMPPRLASSSLIQTTGPPRLSVSMCRLSLYVLWHAPFLVRRDEVQLQLGWPLGFLPATRAGSSDRQAGGSCTGPRQSRASRVVLVELLAAGEGAP